MEAQVESESSACSLSLLVRLEPRALRPDMQDATPMRSLLFVFVEVMIWVTECSKNQLYRTVKHLHCVNPAEQKCTALCIYILLLT